MHSPGMQNMHCSVGLDGVRFNGKLNCFNWFFLLRFNGELHCFDWFFLAIDTGMEERGLTNKDPPSQSSLNLLEPLCLLRVMTNCFLLLKDKVV